MITLTFTISHARRGQLISLVGFNEAFNTIRLYKRSTQGYVQIEVLSGNHKTKYAVIFRLPKEVRSSKWKKHKNKNKPKQS